MNGIHDMGGMHGFGAIEIEVNEPVFHEVWEARVYGISRAMTRPEGLNVDLGRYTREIMPPELYLESSYYERWLWGFEWALMHFGSVALDELRSGHATPDGTPRTDARSADQVLATINHKSPSDRRIEDTPRFDIGARVRTKNVNPSHHTRLPRYARDKAGTVRLCHGAHVLPDKHAHGGGENPEHLYTVAFEARELWGADAPPRDEVMLDLWESYLEPA
ncbi:MAG: nitrile hydratase subunit beta [Pseudomonadota bacterium]